MKTFAIYLLEVSICLALFYSVYILLKGDTFYYLKRFYLIFTVILSLIIPQLNSPGLSADIEQLIMVEATQDLSNVAFQDTFGKVVFGQIPEHIFESGSRFLSLFNILGILYLLGVFYFLFRLIKNLFHIYHLYRKNEKEIYKNFRIIQLPGEYPTFSFFNFIFLNKKNLSDEEKNDVILHEIVHVKQKHSIDILFMEICRILFWFNPIIWLCKSSLVKVHECLADQYFIENKPDSIIDYQSLLLKQYLSKIHIELAHPFNYSLIKYRIKMMTKNKSKWWAKYKLVLALPIVIISLVAFSNADINLNDKIRGSRNDLEAQPDGMVFIPQGSFVMKRNVGESVSERNVTVDAFWMKETEVTVKEYFEYLQSVKEKVSPEEYELLLPDVSKAPFENYFTNKKYRNYPVVGVSYKQARVYCMWLTNDENEKISKSGGKPIHDYRLPLEAEWVYASFGGVQPDKIKYPKVTALAKTRTGKPNDWGIYNIFDNVSEWTASNFVTNLDSMFSSSSRYLVFPLGLEDEFVKRVLEKGLSPGQKMKAEPVTAKKYLQEELEPSQKIVRGNNYKDLIPDGLLNHDYHQAYDYVGFRYVRSYMGGQEL